MATKNFTPIYGKRIRVLPVDECGNVPDNDATGVVGITDGFITMTMAAETEDGTEIVSRKADGSICINEMGNPSFKRLTLEIEFCGVHPSILAIVSNAEEYEDYAGDVAGFTLPEGEINKRFSFELWSGVTGAACVPGVDFQGGYFLLPQLQAGTLGDITADGENAVTFTMTGAFTRGGNNWGVGPFDVLLDDSSDPAPLPTPLDPYDHFLLVETTLAPPASANDLQDMPDAA